MTIDVMSPRVTPPIERAETLEDEKKLVEARAAYLDVSMLEEEIATELPASDPEGMIASRRRPRVGQGGRLCAREGSG